MSFEPLRMSQLRYAVRLQSGGTPVNSVEAGYKLLDFSLVRAGGLGLCSRDFNRLGWVQDAS